MPLTRMVKQADGSTRKEPVPLSDYRALRWEIGTLAAGATTAVSLRVRIDAPVVAHRPPNRNGAGFTAAPACAPSFVSCLSIHRCLVARRKTPCMPTPRVRGL
jgi:hypothetical protein